MNRQPRILVIDDEEIARKNLSHILEKDAYEVLTAEDGRDALAKLSAASFDVVISDLKMPGINGMEILENIRQTRPDTRVVMVTGMPTATSAVEAMGKGRSYISKPFKLEEVRAAVREALESRTKNAEHQGFSSMFCGSPGHGRDINGQGHCRCPGKKIRQNSTGRTER